VIPAPKPWVDFIDTELGFMLAMDTTKHTPAQINATYKLLEFIASTHKFSADRPEDGSATTLPVVRS